MKDLREWAVRVSPPETDSFGDREMMLTHRTFSDVVRDWRFAEPAEIDALRLEAISNGAPEERLAPGFQKRIIEITGSDESVDRYNSRILIDGDLNGRKFGTGWQLEQYRKNPVFMPMHDYRDVPVGQALRVYKDTREDGSKRLRFVILFTDKEENPLGDTMLRLYQGGFMRASSVGWIPKKMYRPENYDDARELGFEDEDAMFAPCIFATSELLELSGVPVPGNAGTADDQLSLSREEKDEFLYLADEANEIAPGFSMQVRAMIASTKTVLDLGSTTNGSADLVDVIDPDEDDQDGDDVDDDDADQAGLRIQMDDDQDQDLHLVEGVVPSDVSNTPAPRGTAWNAPALSDFTDKAWGDLTTAEKRRIAGHFAWSAANPPSSFGDLKLPHHRASDGYVVFRGIVAAAGRLGQADIPASDIPMVKAHLRRHYRLFEKEIPDSLKISPAGEERQGFEIQTLLFPKAKWSKQQAVKWAQEHDFDASSVDSGGKAYRLRQREPDDFERIRALCLTPGGSEPNLESCRVLAMGGPLKSGLAAKVDALRGDVAKMSTLLETFVKELLSRGGKEVPAPALRPDGEGGPNGSDANPDDRAVYGDLLDVAKEVREKLGSAK